VGFAAPSERAGRVAFRSWPEREVLARRSLSYPPRAPPTGSSPSRRVPRSTTQSIPLCSAKPLLGRAAHQEVVVRGAAPSSTARGARRSDRPSRRTSARGSARPRCLRAAPNAKRATPNALSQPGQAVATRAQELAGDSGHHAPGDIMPPGLGSRRCRSRLVTQLPRVASLRPYSVLLRAHPCSCSLRSSPGVGAEGPSQASEGSPRALGLMWNGPVRCPPVVAGARRGSCNAPGFGRGAGGNRTAQPGSLDAVPLYRRHVDRSAGQGRRATARARPSRAALPTG